MAIAITPNADALYTGTYGGGIFKSVDGGTTWAGANTSATIVRRVLALAIDPTTPATVYAGTE